MKEFLDLGEGGDEKEVGVFEKWLGVGFGE